MDARVSAIVSKLVYQIQETMDEFSVTEEELMEAITFLTEVGKNEEYHLLSDVLGFSVKVNENTHGHYQKENITEHNVEGPLYREDAPIHQHEACLFEEEDEPGDILYLSGKVISTDGKPVPHTIVDVWQSNARGDYENEDPDQAEYNYRRKIKTDEQGNYKLKTIIPGPYQISKGGHVGKLLQKMGRHDWRPAHIHFKISGKNVEPLTTMLFIEDDPWVNTDAIGAVKDSLILKMEKCDDPNELAKYNSDTPFYVATYDFVIQTSDRYAKNVDYVN